MPDTRADEPTPSEKAEDITLHQILELPGRLELAELSPVGPLNIESADTFRVMFLEMLNRGVTRFLLNLKRVDYIDSTGLGALLQLHREAKARAGGLWLYNLAPAVRTIFEVTNLHKIVDLDWTREAALAQAEEA